MTAIIWVTLYTLAIYYGNVYLFLLGMGISYIHLAMFKTAKEGGFDD